MIVIITYRFRGNSATKMINRNSDGMAEKISISRIPMMSTRPEKYPINPPMKHPITTAIPVEMNPIDTADRIPYMKDKAGIGYCNITKCCTNVCPEHIHITDNAIIPLKERVVDRFYDPVTRLFRMIKG